VAATAPIIILVRPQLGENIGHVARAMANFSLHDLRLVAPRDGWPNPAAEPTSAGATWILDEAQVFDTTEAAVADLHAVFATTARPRGMIKDVATPRHAAGVIRNQCEAGRRVGVLFGAEATGLTNEEIVLAETLITIPTAPDFASLNIAQAVLLVAYEWLMTADKTPGIALQMGEAVPATQAEVEGLMRHLEEELHLSGFLRPEEKAPSMVRNLRNIFLRLQMTDQDVRTLRGMIKSLALYGRSAGKPRK
jgi:tRNA/rRNA methyltransferase